MCVWVELLESFFFLHMCGFRFDLRKLGNRFKNKALLVFLLVF